MLESELVRQIIIGLIGLGLLATILLLLGPDLTHDLYADERWGWVAAVRLAAAPTWPEALRYACTTGPALVGLWSLMGLATGFSIAGMRWVQLALGTATLVAAYRLNRVVDRSGSWLPVLAILAAPYFLTSTFFLYSDAVALLFLMLLVGELEDRERSRPLRLGLITALLVHVRIPVGPVIAGWFFWELHAREAGWRARILACVVGTLTYAPFAWLIGGLLGPGLMGVTGYPGIWPIPWSFGILGLFLAPWVLCSRPRPGLLVGSVLVGLLGLVIEALPATGPFGTLVGRIALGVGPGPARFVSAVIVGIGFAILVGTALERRSSRLLYLVVPVIVVPVFLRSVWFERYTLPVIAILAAYLPRPDGWRRVLVAGWMTVWLLLSMTQTARWMGAMPGLTRWPSSLEHTIRVPWRGAHRTLEQIADPGRSDPRDNLHDRLVEESRRALRYLEGGDAPAGNSRSSSVPSGESGARR